MNQSQNVQPQGSFLADCARIYREWHDRAKAIDTEGLLALYAEDAVLESRLVPAILDDKSDGILRGESELRRFFVEGGRRRPNDLVRWYRTGEWLTDGRRLLVWDHPRQAPNGSVICSAKAASLPARSSANTIAGCAGGAQSSSN